MNSSLLVDLRVRRIPCRKIKKAGGFIKSDNEETEDNLRQRKEENSKLFYEDKRHKLLKNT